MKKKDADYRKKDTSDAEAFWEVVRQTAAKAKDFSEERLRQLGDEWLDSPRDVSTKEPSRDLPSQKEKPT